MVPPTPVGDDDRAAPAGDGRRAVAGAATATDVAPGSDGGSVGQAGALADGTGPASTRTDGAIDESGGVQPSSRPIAPGTEWMVQLLSRPLAWLWDRGFRFLFILDSIALLIIMLVTNLVRYGTVAWPNNPPSFYITGFGIAIAIHLSINYFFGLYEREPRLGVTAWLPRVLFAISIGVATQGLATLLLDRYLMPRGNLIVLLVVGSIALAGNRHIARFLAVRREGPPRVVLVGPPTSIQLAETHLSESDRGAIIVGRVEEMDRLVDAVEAGDATDVLLLDVTAFSTVFPDPLNQLESKGVGFLQRVSGRETLLGLQSIRQVAGMPFVHLHGHTVATHKLRFKRLFDRVLVIVTAPVWLLVIGALVIYVALRAGRPVFYRQARIGLWGKVFQVFKFRTMVRDAEAAGPQLSSGDGDPRIVRGLGWMRSTRADELPQLFNIVLGQMSLVGPRPERPELVEEISSRVPGYVMRHELPPGLTGLAQIHGRYTTDAEYKLGYDLQYMVNWSPVLDVQIMARTVWVVISRRV